MQDAGNDICDEAINKVKHIIETIRNNGPIDGISTLFKEFNTMILAKFNLILDGIFKTTPTSVFLHPMAQPTYIPLKRDTSNVFLNQVKPDTYTTLNDGPKNKLNKIKPIGQNNVDLNNQLKGPVLKHTVTNENPAYIKPKSNIVAGEVPSVIITAFEKLLDMKLPSGAVYGLKNLNKIAGAAGDQAH